MKHLLALAFSWPLVINGMQPSSLEELNKKLVSAIRTDNLGWVQRLIAQGAQADYIIKTPGYTDRTILTEAVSNSRNAAIIRLLLQHGANPHLGISEQTTPVYSLINRVITDRSKLPRETCAQMLEYLFEAGAVIDESAQKLIEAFKLESFVDMLLKQKIM